MNVLQEFISAIEIEHKKKIEEYEKLMALPMDERIEKGITMSNLRVEFDFFDGTPNQFCRTLPSPLQYISTAKIYCENNISKFKEGSTVILSNGEYSFKMEVEEDTVDHFSLKTSDFEVKYCYVDVNNYPHNNWEINETNSGITAKLLLTAAQLLADNDALHNKIYDFLNGITRNRYGNFPQEVLSLNISQNMAYLNAINSSDFCLVQGPPGTGKTETIGYIAKFFLDRGLRVFVTAPTHTAINNCINSISSKVKDAGRVIKIGEKVQNKELLENNFVTRKSRFPYSSSYDQKGIVIGATAYSLCYPASKRLDGWEFDVAIIDEASQMSIPLSIAAMCRTGKYIFVGDHKQLDPIIPKESNNEMFAESVFARLARIYPNEINLLKISYRLNENLIRIPNTLFYQDQLHSDTSTKIDNSEYRSDKYSDVLNNDAHALVLHDVFDGQARSPFEAKVVAELVFDLFKNDVGLNNIGIMTPYRAQVREIKKQIKRIMSWINPRLFEMLFVDTVDRMQGQERDYIIFSMTNTNPLESKRRLDFFYSPNRLNVGITRAMKKCIVIANYKVFDIQYEELQSHEEYNDLMEGLNAFRDYYSLSTKIEISEYDEHDDVW